MELRVVLTDDAGTPLLEIDTTLEELRTLRKRPEAAGWFFSRLELAAQKDAEEEL